MFGTILNAVRNEGIRRGAYVGLSASILRQMTYSLARFSTYDMFKSEMARKAGGDPNKVGAVKMGLAASLAGGIGGVVGNPADIVLVRMIGDVNHAPEHRKNYRNWCVAGLQEPEVLAELTSSGSFDGLLRMIREEGVQSLFRGLGPNVARAVLMNASQLATCVLLRGSVPARGADLGFDLADTIPLSSRYCEQIYSRRGLGCTSARARWRQVSPLQCIWRDFV